VQRFYLETIFQIACTQTNLLKTARNDIIIPTFTDHYYGCANKNHCKQFSLQNTVKCMFPWQNFIFFGAHKDLLQPWRKLFFAKC